MLPKPRRPRPQHRRLRDHAPGQAHRLPRVRRALDVREINLLGIQALGLGLAHLCAQRGAGRIVVGHDFRSYSRDETGPDLGLLAGGIEVVDIGLALSPMAYFAQFDLDCPCVAMVTASHNENGWTGVKMGVERPLTFGPDEMGALKEIVLGGRRRRPGGGVHLVEASASATSPTS